ncbi:hypothetical protein CPB84DRAFT_1802067 [Gymnopilus junonius]|uniref:Secreted protein n=1 Tax=Gymnopilus junonius TaxID=109634 RepID=A0A9P5N7Q8_GYMJU|nr:hypothetical protein CPB84DRAFT_1802067 [Gymnopilus junonius]
MAVFTSRSIWYVCLVYIITKWAVSQAEDSDEVQEMIIWIHKGRSGIGEFLCVFIDWNLSYQGSSCCPQRPSQTWSYRARQQHNLQKNLPYQCQG